MSSRLQVEKDERLAWSCVGIGCMVPGLPSILVLIWWFLLPDQTPWAIKNAGILFAFAGIAGIIGLIMWYFGRHGQVMADAGYDLPLDTALPRQPAPGPSRMPLEAAAKSRSGGAPPVIMPDADDLAELALRAEERRKRERKNGRLMAIAGFLMVSGCPVLMVALCSMPQIAITVGLLTGILGLVLTIIGLAKAMERG